MDTYICYNNRRWCICGTYRCVFTICVANLIEILPLNEVTPILIYFLVFDVLSHCMPILVDLLVYEYVVLQIRVFVNKSIELNIAMTGIPLLFSCPALQPATCIKWESKVG